VRLNHFLAEYLATAGFGTLPFDDTCANLQETVGVSMSPWSVVWPVVARSIVRTPKTAGVLDVLVIPMTDIFAPTTV